MDKFPEMVSYFDRQLSVSLELPVGWSIGSSPDFMLLLLSKPEDGYRTNLGITRVQQNIETPAQFQQVIDKTKADQISDYASFQQIEETHFLQDGYPAYLQRYEWQPDETQYRFSQVLAFVVTGQDVVYEIHGATLKQLEQFFMPTLVHIIKSIRFIPTE